MIERDREIYREKERGNEREGNKENDSASTCEKERKRRESVLRETYLMLK